MGKPGAGKQPRTQYDVFRYGRKLGGEIRGGGKHMKIVNPRTGASVPVPGPGDIATGTLHSIMRRLTTMFAVVLVCVIPICLIIWLIVGLSNIY